METTRTGEHAYAPIGAGTWHDVGGGARCEIQMGQAAGNRGLGHDVEGTLLHEDGSTVPRMVAAQGELPRAGLGDIAVAGEAAEKSAVVAARAQARNERYGRC